MNRVAYAVPFGDGAALAWLYEHGEVVERHDGENGVSVSVRLLPADQARFESQYAVGSLPEDGAMES